MAMFHRMSHSWEWLAPATATECQPFVEAYNDAVDPFSINRNRRISVDEFVNDDEYDPSEFTMWAESVWHYAVIKSGQKYADGAPNRWLEVRDVLQNLLIDGPDINDLGYDPIELNPDASC